MTIAKLMENGTLIIVPNGRLNSTTSQKLEAELESSLSPEVRELVFDFTELEYMSSAGIRVVMAAEAVMSKQGSMKLIHVNEEIMEIFEMTGLNDYLHIEA